MTILMVVAIDFGTTYSGYAFSMKSDPLKIHSNQAWNGGKKQLISAKTPTCLLLNKEKEIISFGYEAEDTYAELVLDNEHHEYFFFDRFKMKLYGNEIIDTNMEIEDMTGKKMLALDVFGKSIKALTDHFMNLLKTEGKDSLIKWSEIQWVLTVPAIWSDGAKQFMRKSAEKGNIPNDNLVIALEPEAASIYCQHLPKEKLMWVEQSLGICGKGTKYMVVDLGGGTADITVHERVEDGKVTELCRARGSDCGGTSVDIAFIELFEYLADFPLIKMLKREDPTAYLDLLREFEVAKRKIDIHTTGKVNICLPLTTINSLCEENKGKSFEDLIKASIYTTDIQLRGDKIRFAAHIIRNLFDQVIEKITSLINDTMMKISPKRVCLALLVGGFSECRFIQSRLQNSFPETNIIVPEEAGLSVLKGAVLFGHDPGFISCRVMQYSYGTDSYVEFDPEEFEVSRMEILEGKTLCKIFHEIVSQDTPVLIGTEIEHEYTTVGAFQNTMTVSVFASDQKDPKYVDEKGCRKIGDVIVEIPCPSEEKRLVVVNYVFGKTEINVKAKEQKTGTNCEAHIKLL